MDKGIIKIMTYLFRLMCCIVRSIENSALVKLLLTKTYLINANE